MGYPLPKLTSKNQHQFFGKKVKHGDLFNYSQVFLHNDVVKLAKKHGYWVDYCKPESKEYKMHGCFTCYAYEIEASANEMIKNSEEKSLPDQWGEFSNKITTLLSRFEEKKEEAAKVREELREIADEITEVVESFDDGVEGMEEALETFKHAIDDMSRYV